MPKIVRDVMKSDIVTVSPDTPLPELQREFLSARVGALPVVGADGRLEGIVSRSDVVRQFSVEQSLVELTSSGFDAELGGSDSAASVEAIGEAVGRRLAGLHARDLMIHDVETTSPDESLADAAKRMLRRRIHRLPVVEEGRLVGIVTALDYVAIFGEGAA
jgi:CBS domain-containing protein